MTEVYKEKKPMKQPYNSYLIDDELYVGVSTFLNMESMGDFLTTWVLRTFGSAPDPIQAHRDYMDSVSQTGTQIHKYIEHDMAGEEEEAKIYANEQTIAAIESYLDWKKEHKIEVLASERVVHHTEWRCAGTLDAVLKIDGKLYVVDFKTGKFKDRYFTQLAAYWAMLCNEPKKKRIPGIETAELAVLEILRDGDEVKLITLNSKYQGVMTTQDQLGIFHALRYIWYMRNLKTRQFAPVIKNMKQLLDPMDKNFQATFNLTTTKEK